jgi:hypothetical protein
MEGAGILRGEQITRRPGPLRLAAGIGVLVLLALVAMALAPAYYRDWQLKRYLHALVEDPAIARKPADFVEAAVVDRAASMGLPVHITDVHVTIGAKPAIQVLYVVHVDLPIYTVDLHFRPTA